ncbi:hypothetical protein EXU57_03175 [Segetibacter sp. 3557_3]|uniref:S41 family peptidase n=1 Tax=Segetibacter sp. 3557_3 TaxID=2547429 RepID=UPI0010587302|nr:S41 family peptidase [Segetibacter sp. 3557_3]TDH29084.1 hypothetical protein EXU57_03175 [Segetibacter sp. 3557_3]
MKLRILIMLVLSSHVFISPAQNSPYLADLYALRNIIEKTPSYQAQIQKRKRLAYEALYKKLVVDSVSNTGDYRYFYNLAQLLFPIRDNHLGFYQVPDYSQFKTEESIQQYLSSKAFREFPSLSIDFDSLKRQLENKPLDSIEGIYYYGNLYTVGLFKKSPKEYTGVVLSSKVNWWEAGQIAINLFEFEPGLFKAIYSHPITKNYYLYPVERYRNHSLLNASFYGSLFGGVYAKDSAGIDHVRLPATTPRFVLKNIAGNIQYLRVGSFQLNPATAQASKKFYDSVRNALNGAYMILDLRNNEGGAKKPANNYFNLVKRFARKKRVYVLLNNETISQAELLTLRLRKLKNVTTVGQTTKGMLAYGSNFGRTLRLPSNLFAVYPTDMKRSKERLLYEDYGIKPAIMLNNQQDWIEQVAALIIHK